MNGRFPGISDFDILELALQELKYHLTEAGEDRAGLAEVVGASKIGAAFGALDEKEQDRLLDALEGCIRKFAKGLLIAVDATARETEKDRVKDNQGADAER